MEIHTCALEVEFHNSYNEYLLSLTEMANVSPWSNYTSGHENTSFHTQVLTKGNSLSASQKKHQYEATYGNRILHSFPLKEKIIF